jgi:glucuronate isomerase
MCAVMTERPFIHDDFILGNDTARRLYHDYAEEMPIIDYHCHLSPLEIAEDRRWGSITEAWLGGDHYKWRAMRSNGIDEQLITGDAGDWEKFEAWAATMPRLLGNPLYHWNQLELARYFDVFDLLGPESARDVYNRCNIALEGSEFSARGLIEKSRVVAICTTDDPCDSLEHHAAIAQDSSFSVQVLPAWRPDRAMMPELGGGFNQWVDALGASADAEIGNFSSFMGALHSRHAFFHEQGCRLSDHGIETFHAEDYTASQIDGIFDKVRSGRELSADEVAQFKSHMLYEFGVMDADRGWVQQYHFGALRNNSARLFRQLGGDVGCDSIGDWPVALPMSRLFSRLDLEGKLAKTILYPINPRDNELVGSMIGNFQDGTSAGKIQMGSGWWFNDQMDGMLRQMEALGQLGLLSRFVGMLTDSRSFLSFTRHEYFRRILCNKLGSEMESGLLPADEQLVGSMVRDISYNNAAGYFDFGVEQMG